MSISSRIGILIKLMEVFILNQDEELKYYKKIELSLTIRNDVIAQQIEIYEDRARYLEAENRKLNEELENNRKYHKKDLDQHHNEYIKILNRGR